MSANEPGSRTSPDAAPDPDNTPTVGTPAAATDAPPGADAAADKDGEAVKDGGADKDTTATDAKTATGAKATARKPRRRYGFWIEFPVLLIVALLLSLVLKTWVVEVFYIPSGSMQNTLAIGDRILINRFIYHFRGIARGDIVVFDGNGSWNPQPTSQPNVAERFLDDVKGIFGSEETGNIYIKRVIGLPGDHVACCNAENQITVNGVALNETSYLYPGNAPSLIRFNITVPPGRLWVMGDHRAISADSRYHMQDPGEGTIPESGVLGRAFVKIWPPSQWGFLNIPSTFGQPKLSGSAAGALPLTLGVAGAIPLTAGEAALRRRLSRRRPSRGRSPKRRRTAATDR
jgi:signal peptidase I